jgi:2-polyprenyl-3-methyl-5-hydroxy-6-metoxy-1,4-benzoquinol methylase
MSKERTGKAHEPRYQGWNPNIFRLVENNMKVLDIGCAAGFLGKALKEEKKCLVVGMDIDRECIELAKTNLDEVITGDIEEIEKLSFPEKFFDIIIFGDVLEHLRSPERALLKSKRYLSDSGYIIVSVPNIACINIRAKLLLGRFNYENVGILDKTHLRFFTLKTTINLLNECGFDAVYLECKSAFPGGRFPKIANLWKTLLGYQFIIKAKNH